MDSIVKSSETINGKIVNVVDKLDAVISEVPNINASLSNDAENLKGSIGIPYVIASGSGAKFFTTSPVNNPIGLIREGEEHDYDITVNDVINKMLHSDDTTLNYTIKSIIGTSSEKIYLSELESGLYRIYGNYQIIRDIGNEFINNSYSNLFIINNENEIIVRICDGIDLIKIYKNSNSYIIDRFSNISDIPTKLSQLTNDNGFIDNNGEIDPTVPAWAKDPNKPNYNADEVGAINKNDIVTTSEIDLMFATIFGH